MGKRREIKANIKENVTILDLALVLLCFVTNFVTYFYERRERKWIK